MKYLLLIIILVGGFLIYKNTLVGFAPTPSPSIDVSTTPSQIPYKLKEPIAEFKTRITKKFFGTYITPQNSPVSPEKYTGFHTGVDVEYEDITSDIPVYSIDDGQVIYSDYVSGYGGFIAIQYPEFIGIYGHIRPSTLPPNKSIVKKGDIVGILGSGYTFETDNERKHLHFAILKGSKIDFRGYVQSESELSLWINPLDTFFKNSLR